MNHYCFYIYMYNIYMVSSHIDYLSLSFHQYLYQYFQPLLKLHFLCYHILNIYNNHHIMYILVQEHVLLLDFRYSFPNLSLSPDYQKKHLLMLLYLLSSNHLLLNTGCLMYLAEMLLLHHM